MKNTDHKVTPFSPPAFSILLKVIALTFFLGGNGLLHAQRYPATTSIQIIPPYSNDLDKYSQAGNDRLLATVVFHDFSQSNWNVKLRLTIQGGSVQLQTSPEAPVNAINLIPGSPEQLTGFDLADYLNYNNMVISGISHEDLIKKGGLPDGLYTFMLEALDFRTGIPISNRATATAWLILNDPPQITFPMCGERIPYMDPQNIPFQWLPMHLSSPNSSFNTEYEFTLVEMPEGLNANEAILSGMPMLNTTSNTPNFLYSATEPLLQNGTNYAFRIRATDSENLGLFKNEGNSQACWFSYGYSTNGSIGVLKPANNSLLNAKAHNAFAWGAPNNITSGQPVSYAFRIYELAEGEDPTAIVESAPAVFEELIPESMNSQGWSIQLNADELETEKRYAWQVKAITTGIEVASSEVQVFNASPAVPDFLAGPHTVHIVSLNNDDFENFSGKGRVKLLEDGTELDVEFSGLKIISSAGKLFLSAGEINQKLPVSFSPIVLAPEFVANGESTFYPMALRMNRNGMEISGTVLWALPWPVQSGDQPFVRSEEVWINFDNLKLNGTAKLADANRFQLLDPFGFDIELLTSSNFFLRENQFTQNFDVDITLPLAIKGINSTPVKLSLKQANQLFTNETSSLDKPIVPVNSVGMHLVPKQIILDLSEQSSPEKLSATPAWKGVYFRTFDVEYLNELDKEQLKLSQPIKHSFEQASDEGVKSWADGEGLDFSFEKEFEQSETNYSTFNEFSGKLIVARIDVENSRVTEGRFEGNILIPFLQENYFDYILSVSDDGFEEGYLKEELSGKNFTMNSGKPDELQYTIRQATFADNERLDIVMDMNWPAILANLENVDGFKVWGNGIIGFNSYQGRKALSVRAEGNLKGYPLVVTEIGAGYQSGNYFFAAETEISISSDLSGPNGPTTVSFYATQALSENDATYAQSMSIKIESILGSSIASASRSYNRQLVGRSRVQEGDMLIDSTSVKLDVFIGSFEGYIKFTENDPDWGNCWQGSFDFHLNIPVQSQLGATYIAGRSPDGFDFWFVDVSSFGVGGDNTRDSKLAIQGKAGTAFSGKKKTFERAEDGSKKITIGALAITGLELRLYKHMRHSEPGSIVEGGQGLEISFEPDASVVFGGMGRVAMIDLASEGDVLKLDLALELVQLTSGKFIYGFEGSVDTELPSVDFSGTGKITYNQEEEHFIGDFWVIFVHKVVCMEGGFAVDIKPGSTKVSIGTPERKVIVIPTCKGTGGAGYLIFNHPEYELGLGIAFNSFLRGGPKAFQARADFGFSAGFMAAVQTNPVFQVKEAGLWAELFASVSVEYEMPFSSGIWTLGNIKMTGMMTMYFEPDTRIEGTLHGEAELVGIVSEFDMAFVHTFPG